MDEIQSLIQGFAVALTFKNLALMFVGIVLGVIIGVLPGLGGANGVAILLPLTFSMAQQPGGTTSAIVANFALEFGPPEFFAVYLLTFCAFVGMSKEPPFKTLASMMLGFALAAVGTDPVTGALRMTFGTEKLLTGFDFLVAVIGLFGIGEILLTLEEGLAFKGASARINMRVVLDTWKELPRYWMTSLRASAVGCFMGIVPGGATPASFMSYGVARRFSPNGDKFGTGQVEGVVAPETAAHAAGTSALLPMITLGVPGSPTAAVLLGGLLIWGLQPGPLLFVEQKDFVWGLIASM